MWREGEIAVVLDYFEHSGIKNFPKINTTVLNILVVISLVDELSEMFIDSFGKIGQLQNITEDNADVSINIHS